MRTAFFFPMPDLQREPLGRRATALAVVIAVHLLLLLLLVMLAPPRTPTRPSDKVFTLRAIDALKAAPAPAPTAQARTKPRPDAPRMPKPIVTPPPRPDAKPALFGTELFEAVDITKLPNHSEERAVANAEAEGVGAAGDSTAAVGPGGGPHGETLYNAEWVREPTNAELAYYLPSRGIPPGSWGTIACRTISRFHVEDCAELGESPPGSGLARALRQAAWQFLVRPPRVGGKLKVGEWVSIRIDFSETGAK